MSDNKNENKFIYGVLETIEIQHTSDIGVVGRLKGTINVNDQIYLTNFGDDDDELVVSTVVAIKVDKEMVKTASDGFAILVVRDGASENIKPGTVIHSGNVEEDEIHFAYSNAIGEYYVGKKDLELYESEMSKMSITDCSEAWKIFIKVHEKKEGSFTKEEVEEFRRKIGILSRNLAKKILAADEIYCVFNKRTGEPHMFSKTSKINEDYVCSPPEVHVFSKPFKEIGEKHFPKDLFEIRKIENGENNDGIKNFLYDVFYLNGAMGMRMNFEVAAMGADTIIPKPNYFGLKEHEIPVTNPNLVRWMLLRSQIANPQTDAEKMIAKIYYRFFALELLKAKFVVPAKPVEDSENPAPIPEEIAKQADGAEIKQLRFPIMVGKNRRNLVFLFTDMKRLRGMYDEEWSAFSQDIEKFIKTFDVGINISNHYSLGCYVNKETIDDIKKTFLGMKPEDGPDSTGLDPEEVEKEFLENEESDENNDNNGNGNESENNE